MPKKKVLIVEDEALVLLDLRVQLEAMGYSIAGMTSSGEEAVRLAAEMRPDIIFMDLGLEGKLGGLGAAAEIHKKSDVPILFVTAGLDTRNPQNTLPSKRTAVLPKPFSVEQMQTAIDDLFFRQDQESHVVRR